jgi:hypothetical protein
MLSSRRPDRQVLTHPLKRVNSTVEAAPVLGEATLERRLLDLIRLYLED